MPAENEEHLSRISTHWSLVFRAHEGQGTTRTTAQAQLLYRYRGAIYRYLRSVVGDLDTVEDLCQEFACRFVRGDFHNANPACGRFRNFVKTAVIHLIADWRRRQRAGVHPIPLDNSHFQDIAAPQDDPGQKFEELWRAELLDRVWEQLAQLQRAGEREQSWFCTALRYRVEHPELSAAEMAEQLGRQLSRPLTEENVRTTLRRAREKFAGLLVDEVARSLQVSTPEQLRDELTELGLVVYCQPVLAQRGL
jgi:RNA polymerase sigma factor (sigma-70 family)